MAAEPMELAAPGLDVHSTTPFCAGPPAHRLVESAVTPSPLFFVRNHGDVPEIDRTTYRLVVDGLVRRRLRLPMWELADRFAWRHVTATLQCAGNRRAELTAVQPLPNELMWGGDAIGTARWTGVSLGDVLFAAGLQGEAQHVWAEGLDCVPRDGRATPFGSSIPLEGALANDVLLAFLMNGEVLPALHGAPLRLVVPGVIGARSVKWLGRLHVAAEPSPNPFQQHGYKLQPSTDLSIDELEVLPPIHETPLTAYICSAEDGSSVPAGAVTVAGYATAGATSLIRRVELALDEGPWQPCTLLDLAAPGRWVRWQADVHLTPGAHRLCVRAHDTAGNEQPQWAASVWNARGYLNNAWHRVSVRAIG